MEKKKIAILGGGVGAMTAAFELTNYAGWKDRYDVEVFTEGWRLGGKGASGRNREKNDRIEEHGLHIFLGFYENAFATMQRLYLELGRNPERPLASWDEAWKKHSYYVLEEKIGDRMVPWVFDFPENSDVPGTGGELPSVWAYVEMLLGWLKNLFKRTSIAPEHTSVTEERLAAALPHALEYLGNLIEPRTAEEGIRYFLHAVADLFREGPSTITHNTFLHLAHYHARNLPDDTSRHSASDHEALKKLLREFITWLKRHWAEESQISIDIRRALILLDLGVATVIGMLEDKLILPPVDWFKIDHVRFEDWLMQHGADKASVESPPILLLSELVFARWSGVGAGTCLHYTLRMGLTYKGAFSWKMQAGMGDTVFGPFYEVLRRRGVKFNFFHSVEEVGLEADPATGRKVVGEVKIGVQMELAAGRTEYEPLYDVNGVPSWPSEPFYEQLDRGEELKRSGQNLENWWTTWKNARTRVLRRGQDFDIVVLGIAVGAYPYICKQLIEDADNPKFAKMVNAVRVTQTQAAQLWFRPDLKGMGWTLPPDPVLGTYYEPFDTWADMTHLLPRERFPPATVGGLQYLTSQLQDHGDPPNPPRSDWEFPLKQQQRAYDDAKMWLTKYVRDLWPGANQANDPDQLNWDLLHDPTGAKDDKRLDWQYWRAVWSPSERYVMSVPGSVWSRLPSAGTGYPNLVMAGDWTLTAISSGCVEAAVMSGMHASRALTGHPAKIVGDDLPDGSDVNPVPPPHPPLPPPRPRGRYVEIDGNNTPLAPYAAHGSTMYTWVIEADYGRLQALLDERLNLGGPITYRPFGPFLSFVAATIDQMAPKEPSAWLSEKDFGFWIPVLAGRQDGDFFNVLRPAFFIPYLWVDNYLPTTAGREVFGYPKGVGILKNPEQPNDPGVFSVDAFVVPKYGPVGDPESRWSWQPLVKASRAGGGPIGDLVQEFESIAHLGEAVIQQMLKAFSSHDFPVPTLALIRSLLGDLFGMSVPMVFLKQFRDVADGTKACYQAIVESPNKVTPGPIRGGFLRGDWDLEVKQYASVSMVDHLGLRVKDGKIPSAFHFWMKFNFTAEDGTVIWRGA